MALSARLELRQGQSLVITPQLQQAIKLLQLSNLELDAFVEQEMERNPLLAREEGEPEPDETPPEPTGLAEALEGADPSGPAQRELDAPVEDAFPDLSPAERAEAAAPGAPGDEPRLVDWTQGDRNGGFEGDEDGFEQRASRPRSLCDHLSDQAAMAGFGPAERLIAESLIQGLDEAGYLRTSLEEAAERLGCDPADVGRVLARLQGFEPTGVFARDLRECLELQLRERDRLDPAMAVLTAHLDLLARRDFAALKRLCGVDEEDLRDMVAEIRSLTPRPGAAYGEEPTAPVVPDVFVREDPAAGWRVELNSDTLPRLLVDQRYHARVARGARTDQEKTFLADCLASASWLVKSLDQRARTILKVSAEIVRQQDAFLAYGVEHLRPLNLKTVADAIGMHESTVSRVTSNKYVSTPRGVFELKFFFTSAIQSSDGGATHSAEAVRHRIKTLIDAERPGAEVLSDDRIVELLREAGVEIARRTVAKYREAMRIPSSVDRKRLLKEAC